MDCFAKIRYDYYNEDALLELQERAQRGDPRAQYHLGLRQGGRELLEAAANQGHAEAQRRLAAQLDIAEEAAALSWLKKAAAQGNPTALSSLGRRYEKGWGIPRDLTISTDYYRRAAKGGHLDAQFALGVAYMEGKGIATDRDRGYSWINRAAHAGYPPARGFLSELEPEFAKEYASPATNYFP